MGTILKCKMCGGDIEVLKDMTVGTCLYCGTTLTLPRIDTDKKARMFNRANQYRMENEFDKAYRVYEAILEEDPQEAEAYWGLILSEYGVEYVVDPITKKRIPTCHRTQTKLIKASSNYENAIKNADSESRFVYEDEAEKIDAIQKKILNISYKEDPYDVFICYKEGDENGDRTEDSVLAQNIYDELEKKGLRVFFARISLEDKLGKDYEPYIFSALNSAKVMLVVAACSEHCEAVWVRNEWSRYLRFMEEGDKTLIPVIKGMSPYELPEELSRFQAQDMAKVGAMQDLVRGVQKILGQTKSEKANAALNELLKEKYERQEQEQKKIIKTRKLKICVLVVLLLGIIGASVYKYVIVPRQIYDQAISAKEAGEFEESLSYLQMLGDDYKNVSDIKKDVIYGAALDTYGNPNVAIEYFEQIVEYKDSKEHLKTLWNKKLNTALQSIANYDTAIKCLREAVKYVDDKEEFVNKYKRNLYKMYSLAGDRYADKNYGIAEQIYEALSILNYEKSSKFLKEIVELEKLAESKYKTIIGAYQNIDNGLYLVFKENNQIYLTQKDADAEKNIFLSGWSYSYDFDKECYRVFSEAEKIFEVFVENGQLEINKHKSSVLMSDYEKKLQGTYEKIN